MPLYRCISSTSTLPKPKLLTLLQAVPANVQYTTPCISFSHGRGTIVNVHSAQQVTSRQPVIAHPSRHYRQLAAEPARSAGLARSPGGSGTKRTNGRGAGSESSHLDSESLHLVSITARHCSRTDWSRGARSVSDVGRHGDLSARLAGSDRGESMRLSASGGRDVGPRPKLSL